MTTDRMTIRRVKPEEADRLTALIRRCYGESYIDPAFYDRDVVSERLRTEQLRSIGAFDSTGALVGHMGITRRDQSRITADAGMTLVDPDYRGLGIARRVAGGLAEQAIAMGLVGIHDYPVTVHGATQRIGRGFDVVTGLMLANLPSDVVFEDMRTLSKRTRTSSLIRWLPFATSPERCVFLPGRYEKLIASLYDACFLTRREGSESGGRAAPSSLRASYDARRQILRIDVVFAGGDLALRVADELRVAGHSGAAIAHLDLRLGDPSVPRAVEELRPLGFFFSGLLPEYADGDVLRLQRVDESMDLALAEVIASDSSRAIETFVFEDRP